MTSEYRKSCPLGTLELATQDYGIGSIRKPGHVTTRYFMDHSGSTRTAGPGEKPQLYTDTSKTPNHYWKPLYYTVTPW